MNTYITSDLHLGHANIVAYCSRPFIKDGDLLTSYTCGKPRWTSRETAARVAADMTNTIIANCNARIKPGDIVYHLGDFCTKGLAYGVPSLTFKAEEYERQLHGKWIFVLGNHDGNNGLKGQYPQALMMYAGGLNIYMTHVPPHSLDQIPSATQLILCGHVHNAWKSKWLTGPSGGQQVLMINVGVDVNNYRPIALSEVIGLYRRIQSAASKEKCHV
jgi:calcineurin-like phosphoesterase family protein